MAVKVERMRVPLRWTVSNAMLYEALINERARVPRQYLKDEKKTARKTTEMPIRNVSKSQNKVWGWLKPVQFAFHTAASAS